jgi:hypothetical protein
MFFHASPMKNQPFLDDVGTLNGKTLLSGPFFGEAMD